MKKNKKRLFLLLLSILFALGSATGYYFLTKKIIEGSVKIADGKRQLEEGGQMLARGKAKLASGQKTLSNAKSSYQKVKTAPYLLAPVLPVVGTAMVFAGDKVARKKIASGNQMVSRGENKINAGEAQLAEGRVLLNRGIEQLKFAGHIRTACGIGAIFFTLLSIALGFYWRRSF